MDGKTDGRKNGWTDIESLRHEPVEVTETIELSLSFLLSLLEDIGIPPTRSSSSSPARFIVDPFFGSFLSRRNNKKKELKTVNELTSLAKSSLKFRIN